MLLLTQTSRYQILHTSAHTNFKVPDSACFCSHKFQGTSYCKVCVSRSMQYLVPWNLCEQMYAISGTLKFVWAEACNIWYLEICVSRCMQYLVPWSLCEQTVIANICSHKLQGNRRCIHLFHTYFEVLKCHEFM
jgi:hypothetical protein